MTSRFKQLMAEKEEKLRKELEGLGEYLFVCSEHKHTNE